MKRLLLVTSVLVNIAFVGRYVYNHFSAENKPPLTPSRRILAGSQSRYFEKMAVDKDDIVFIGNSITAGFPLEELFQDLNFKNRGVPGNLSSDILQTIPSICDDHPKAIFLMAGTNDIMVGRTADTVYRDAEKIIRMIDSLAPSTKLYVQSILPYRRFFTVKNKVVDTVNRKIQDFCNHKAITYIDLHAKFVDYNGELDSTITYDGIHLTGFGYLRWKAEITRFISQLNSDL